MKKILFSLCTAVSVLALTACGSVSTDQISSIANKAASATSTAASVASTAATVAGTTSSSADALTNGKTAGGALKTLIAAYKTDGKLSLSGTNLLTATSLVSACVPLKSYTKGDGNYTNFAKGLALGSMGLVTEDIATQVEDKLTSLSGIDVSSVATNASTITSSVSSIVSLLK